MLRTLCCGLILCASALVGAPAAGAAEPYRIGVPTLLSGPGAFVGEAEKNTLTMLAEEMNAAGGIGGRPVEMIYYDTEGKPDVAVRMFNRLIQRDQVVAILGPAASWEALPVKPIVEKAQVPTIMLASAGAIVDPVAKWVFKTPADDRIVAARLLAHLKATGIDRIALVSSQDGFGDGGRREILKQAGDHGIKVTFDERYSMEDADLTPLLNKVRKADARAVVNWSSSRAPVLFATNYKQAGLELPHFQSHAVVSESFLKAAGASAEGIVAVAQKFEGYQVLPDSDPQKAVIAQYRAKYRAKFGKEANQFGAAAYDGFMILVAALRKAGTDREKLRDAIEQTRGYVGVGGTYAFSATDHAGLGGDSLAVFQVGGGSWKLLR